MLKREGYDILTSSDFDSAISVVEHNDLDAALVDIVLPRKSGIELLKALRHREPYIPVIMITGEPNISQIPELVRSGAYDFIAKPVTKDVLIRTVSKAIDKKRLVDEKRRLETKVKQHAEQLEVVVAERTSELAEAHSFLNTVLDSSTEYAIVAVGVEGRITLFNRGAELMLGYSSEEATGKDAGVFLAYKSGESHWEVPFWSAENQAAATPHVEEIELRRFDGSSVFASLAITQIREPGGQLIGYLAIIKDLTAQRDSEEALRQMQARLAHNEKIAALGRMAAQVAHEVRNPLSGLRLYSLHLKDKASEKLAAGDVILIDKIIDGINRLSETVDQVLNFARPITLTRRRDDLNRLVADAFHLLEPQLTANRVQSELHLTEAGAFAMVDEASMRSTLINLMLNSIDAMPGGGRLAVATEASGVAVTLEITDTGSGMTEEHLKNVFEPFYTTKSQGLGLGMSYAGKVIELHGGSIVVKSRPGQGTTITIELPSKE